MNNVIKIFVEEFFERISRFQPGVPREISFPDVPGMINVAVGMRRVGKTYLLLQKAYSLLNSGVSRERMLFINFEDERLLPMSGKELGELLDAFYSLYPENHDRECYLFLDEIQNVDEWPLVVRRFLDSKKVRIYLTGSSAKLLSKEIATSLRGRSVATEVWPFSYQEFLAAQKLGKPAKVMGNKEFDRHLKYLEEYFSVGGFPGVQTLDPILRREVLQSYIDSVVFRDIIERYRITNSALIQHLIKSLIKNVSCPISLHKFYNEFKSLGYKTGKDSLYQYLEYIEDAFLVMTVPLFTESLRQRQSNPKKVYAIDNGLVRANRLGLTLQLGNLFENLIYLDLRRAGKKVYYYKTLEGYEIDFVYENNKGAIELIQAVWDISDPDTFKREERALEAASKELGCNGKLITPREYFDLVK